MKTRMSSPTVGMLAAGVLSLGLTQAVWAENVTIQISKRGAGYPVKNAAVCLGTPANPAQFGARLADDDRRRIAVESAQVDGRPVGRRHLELIGVRDQRGRCTIDAAAFVAQRVRFTPVIHATAQQDRIAAKRYFLYYGHELSHI